MSVSSSNNPTTATAKRVRAVVFIFEFPLLVEVEGRQTITPTLRRQGFLTARICRSLLVYDGFDATGFEECDDAVFAVPDAVASTPDFVGIDLAAARQQDNGLAAASRTDAGSAG